MKTKNLLLIAFCVSFSMTLFGQSSFSLIVHDKVYSNTDTVKGNDTLIANWTSENLVVVHAYVLNNSNVSKEVLVKKTVHYKPVGTTDYYCWKSCYMFGNAPDKDFIIINSGDTNKINFTGDYKPKGNLEPAYISYIFYDKNNPADSVSFVTKYVPNFPNLSLYDENDDYKTGDTIEVQGKCDLDLSTKVGIWNFTSANINVKVKRNVVYESHTGFVNSFSWGGDLASTVDVSPTAVAISANDTNSTEFKGNINFNGTSDKAYSAVVRYTFYDDSNSSDSSFIIVKYSSWSVGVSELLGDNYSVSNPYPNPASDVVMMDVELPSIVSYANVTISNILGKKVLEEKMTKLNEKIIINTSSLDNGIYFCSLVVNGEMISTKRIIINK